MPRVREPGLRDTMLLNLICRTELDPRDEIDGDGACTYMREVARVRTSRKRNATMERMTHAKPARSTSDH